MVEYPKVPGFENSDPQHHYSSCHSASKLVRDPIDGSAMLDIWVYRVGQVNWDDV